jgi:hypothetical protein
VVLYGEIRMHGLLRHGEDLGMSLVARSALTEPRRPDGHGEMEPQTAEIAASAGVGQVHG